MTARPRNPMARHNMLALASLAAMMPPLSTAPARSGSGEAYRAKRAAQRAARRKAKRANRGRK